MTPATVAILGTLCAVYTLLSVSYLISVTRDARLGRRALQVLGGPAPHTLSTAYHELHLIEQENWCIDAEIARAMRAMGGSDVRATGRVQ